jgi:arginine decarboxylase
MPIHRLNEAPVRPATLVDITCDSDGKVSKFIDIKDVRDTLPLHQLRPGEPYYIGIFLVGAYQDIMGDLHNLFGRSNEIHCFLDPTEPNGYYIEEVIPGSTVTQVLGGVQYYETELVKSMKEQVEKAVKEGRMKPSEGVRLLDDYEAGMKEYTYLDCNGHRMPILAEERPVPPAERATSTSTSAPNGSAPARGDRAGKEKGKPEAEPGGTAPNVVDG